MKRFGKVLKYTTGGLVGLELASCVYPISFAQESYRPPQNLVDKGPSSAPLNSNQKKITEAMRSVYLDQPSANNVGEFYQKDAVFKDPRLIVKGRNNILHGIRSTDRLNITTEAGPTFTYFPHLIHISLRNRYKFGFLQIPMTHDAYLELDSETGEIKTHIDLWHNKPLLCEANVAPWFAPISKGFGYAYLLTFYFAPKALGL